MKIISIFPRSLKMMFTDKLTILYSVIPVIIGAILFYLLGSFLYGDLLDYLNAFFEGYITKDSVSSFLYYTFFALVTIAIYFLVSWTFVLVVSFIASPFNDLLSERVEKILTGEKTSDLNNSLKRLLKDIIPTLTNEVKKIAFIIFLSLLAFIFGLVGVLAPVGIAISAFLLVISFVDYSWCRHKYSFRECVSDLKSSWFSYGLSGSLFMGLFAIPILNIFVLPFGVIYYTILFNEKRK